MKLGKDLRLGYVDDQGRFTQFAWAQSCSYDKTTTFVKVSSPNTGGWEHVRPKVKGWVMQHEGLLGNPELVYEYDGEEYNFLDLISYFQDNNIAFDVRWLDVSTDGTVGELKRGTAYIKGHKEVASEKALAKVSVALQGTGPLEDLSDNNLKGAFAYSISGTTLSLYALSRPIAGFNITVKNGDVISDTGQTWDPVGDTLQTFTINALQPTSVIGGIKGDIVQHNITFTNSTTLHVVLLQTTTQNEEQQPVRTVQALWWGGYAMGNMVVCKTGQTDVTLTTAGREKSSDAVTPFPFDILTGDTTITLTGTGQTIHCVSRTTTTQRNITALQQQDNTAEGYALTVTLDQAFGTTIEVWANSEGGTELGRATFQATDTKKVIHIDEQIASAQQIHFRIDGAHADNGEAYSVNRRLIDDLAEHLVYYAIGGGKCAFWAPTQAFEATFNIGGASYTGIATDTEEIAYAGSASAVPAVDYGHYTFINASTIAAEYVGDTGLFLSVRNLYPIVTTNSQTGGTQTIPAYQMARTPIGGAVSGMDTATVEGDTQAISLHTVDTALIVSVSSRRTGSSTWEVFARVSVAQQTTGGYDAGANYAVPGNMTVTLASDDTLTIHTGSSSASVTIESDNALTTPAVELDWWAADYYTIVPTPVCDITEALWRVRELGSVEAYGSSVFADLIYNEGNAAATDIIITSANPFDDGSSIMPNRIPAGWDTAEHLILKSPGSSSGDYHVKVATAAQHAGANGITYTYRGTSFDITFIATGASAMGMQYVVGIGQLVSLTNAAEHYIPCNTALADIVPYVRVKKNRDTTIVYGIASIDGFRPGNGTFGQTVSALTNSPYSSEESDATMQGYPISSEVQGYQPISMANITNVSAFASNGDSILFVDR